MNSDSSEIEWPAGADLGSNSLWLIENYLREYIKNSGINLIGELDFNAKCNYANTNWTVSQLTNYAFQIPELRYSIPVGINTLTRKENEKAQAMQFSYPAIVAIWCVMQAQQSNAGPELFTTANWDTHETSALAIKFRDSIIKLKLWFPPKAKGKNQQNLMLARLHALIPNYALSEFVKVMRRYEEQNRNPQETRDEIINSPDLLVGLKSLFEFQPDIGLEIITRAFLTLRHGKDAGLPPRLTNALLNGVKKGIKSTDYSLLPEIKFDEDANEFAGNANKTWNIVDENGFDIQSHDLLPQASFFVHRITQKRYPIFDLKDGYLIFDSKLKLSPNRLKVPDGGAIAWHANVKFEESILATEPTYIEGWKDWQIAYVKNVESFSLSLENGDVREIGVQESFGLIIDKLENLLFGNLQIFKSAPKISTKKVLRIIDNIVGSAQILQPGETKLVHENGPFDLTISSGIGNSERISGFLLEGIKIKGNLEPIIEGQKRNISIESNGDFSQANKITLDAEHNKQFIELIHNESKQKIQLTVEIPIMEWSILNSNNNVQLTRTTFKGTLEDIKITRRIVLHNYYELPPKITYFEDGKFIDSITPKSSRDKLIYDLKPLRDATPSESLEFKLNLKDQFLSLLKFIKVHSQDNKLKEEPIHKRKMISIRGDFSQLASMAVDRGIIDAGQWSMYLLTRAQENERILKYRRMRRFSK